MITKTRVIASALCLALAIAPLAGCTSKTEGEEREIPMGRYVEETWEFPIETRAVSAMHRRPDGRFAMLLSVNRDFEKQQYYSTSDGTDWLQDPPAWLETMMKEIGYINQIHYNAGGDAAILYYPDEAGEVGSQVAHIATDGTVTVSPLGTNGNPWSDLLSDSMRFSVASDEEEGEDAEEGDEPDEDSQAADNGAFTPGEEIDQETKAQLAEAHMESRLEAMENGESEEEAPEEEKNRAVVFNTGSNVLYLDSVWLRDDGLLYASSYWGTGLFDISTGEMLERYRNTPSSTTIAGDRLVQLLDSDSNYWNDMMDLTVPTVFLFDGTTGAEIAQQPAEMLYGGYSMLAADADGTLYALHSSGVYRLALGGDMWEQIMDGGLFSMSLPSLYIQTLIPHEDGQFLALFASMGDFVLCNYVYSPDTPALPDVELTVYELQHNQFLPQAMASFRKDYPNVLVNIRSASDARGEDAISGDDAIRALNTELLAGTGPDLLLLDYMPLESYMEKGVLADLSDVLDPLVASGEVLDNIAGAYRQPDGKVYAIPTRFSFGTIWGRKEAVAAVDSLEAMIDYAKRNPEQRVIYDLSPELLLYHLGTYHRQHLMKDGALDVDYMEWLLTKVMELAETAGGVYHPKQDEPTVYDPSWDDFGGLEHESLFEMAFGNGSLGFASLAGYTDIMAPSGAAYTANGGAPVSAEAGGSSTVPDNEVRDVFRLAPSGGEKTFTPQTIIGVNAAGSQQDLAKAFVQALLAESTQYSDLQNGFPVNIQAIEAMTDRKAEMVMATSYFDQESGVSNYLEMTWPTKAMLSAISDVFPTLDTPMDQQLSIGEMIDAARPFFEGTATAREVAEEHAQRTRLRLLELE